jgi:hypothetical protein
MLVQIVGESGVKVPHGVGSFGNGVAAVGIGDHRENLVVGNEFVDEKLRALIVPVVVSGAVDEQEMGL